MNKCFEKIENPTNGSKKGCLWALNPDKCKKLEEECKRCRQRDPVNIRLSMSRPDDLNKIERGEQRIKKYTNTQSHNQRKLIDTNNNNCKSLLSATVVTQQQQPQSQQQTVNLNSTHTLSTDSFLLDWTSKGSSVVIKDEVNLKKKI